MGGCRKVSFNNLWDIPYRTTTTSKQATNAGT